MDGLPGISREPEVYETPDVIKDHVNPNDSVFSNLDGAIDTASLPVGDARKHFAKNSVETAMTGMYYH